MIRFKLKELISRKERSDGMALSIHSLAKSTGIHRATLHRMMSDDEYSTVTANLDKLCEFFECEISDLVEYVPRVKDV